MKSTPDRIITDYSVVEMSPDMADLLSCCTSSEKILVETLVNKLARLAFRHEVNLKYL